MTLEQPVFLNQDNSLTGNRVILAHRLEEAIHYIDNEGNENSLSFSPLRTAQLREIDCEGLEVLISQLNSFCMMIRSDQEILNINEEGNLDIQLWHMSSNQAKDALDFIQACVQTVMYIRNSKNI